MSRSREFGAQLRRSRIGWSTSSAERRWRPLDRDSRRTRHAATFEMPGTRRFARHVQNRVTPSSGTWREQSRFSAKRPARPRGASRTPRRRHLVTPTRAFQSPRADSVGRRRASPRGDFALRESLRVTQHAARRSGSIASREYPCSFRQSPAGWPKCRRGCRRLQ